MRDWVAVLAAAVLAMGLDGCASRPVTAAVTVRNLTPGTPFAVTAILFRPPGTGPFPAVVQLHGCGGVEPQSYRWARWFAGRGYVSLVVDSFGARHLRGDCRSSSDDPPVTARLDDALGALRYLQSLPYVAGDRVAAVGWSQGGEYAIAAINGPSLERARKRGVELPAVGFAAAVAVYPGGCHEFLKEQVIRPLLILIGGADDWTPAADCQEMATVMNARGANVAIVVYPGAFHYFDVEGRRQTVLSDVENDTKPGGYGATVGYQAAAAEDTYRQVAAFLARYLKGAGD
jgi:dienelactone hydrolase